MRRSCVLLATLTVLFGCSGSEGTSSDPGTVPGTGSTDSSEAVPLLPSASLLGFDPAQEKLLKDAQTILISQCMKDRGFVYVPYPEFETNPVALRDLYGSISVQQAEKFGYHNPDAARQAQIVKDKAAYDTKIAELGYGDPYYAALQGSSKACTSMANLDLYGTESLPSESSAGLQVIQIAADILKTINADPQFLAAADQWRKCMNGLGYDVQSLSDTRLSYQFDGADTSPPSDEERKKAVADAGCHLESNLDQIVVALYTKAFTQQLDQHQGLADNLKDMFTHAQARALELTGEDSQDAPSS